MRWFAARCARSLRQAGYPEEGRAVTVQRPAAFHLRSKTQRPLIEVSRKLDATGTLREDRHPSPSRLTSRLLGTSLACPLCRRRCDEARAAFTRHGRVALGPQSEAGTPCAG